MKVALCNQTTHSGLLNLNNNILCNIVRLFLQTPRVNGEIRKPAFLLIQS